MILTGMIGISACHEEVTYRKDQLTGHWAVFNAERDGKGTTTLDGAIFQFLEDGTMNTNITGQENSGHYEIKNTQINFLGPDKMLFEIGTLTGDTMSLNTELQGYHFLLDLHRTQTESE